MLDVPLPTAAPLETATTRFCRSADFFLLWDNFLLPGDLLAARCRDGPFAAPDARPGSLEVG